MSETRDAAKDLKGCARTSIAPYWINRAVALETALRDLLRVVSAAPQTALDNYARQARAVLAGAQPLPIYPREKP